VVVIAVEEATFLMPVQRVVGGVEVQHDLLRRSRMRVQKQRHQQPLDRRAIVADAVVAAGLRAGRVLQAVQRGLARQRRAAPPPGGELGGAGRQHRVVPQPVVIHHILVAERNAEHPLHHHARHRVLDELRRPRIAEAGSKAPHQTDGAIRAREQQRAGIGRHPTAVQRRHNGTPIGRCKSKQIGDTLRRHRGCSWARDKRLLHNNFLRARAPMHLPHVRNPG
jgi:hypothetical protein